MLPPEAVLNYSACGACAVADVTGAMSHPFLLGWRVQFRVLGPHRNSAFTFPSHSQFCGEITSLVIGWLLPTAGRKNSMCTCLSVERDVKLLTLAWALAGTSWQSLPRNAVLGTSFAGVLARRAAASCAAH